MGCAATKAQTHASEFKDEVLEEVGFGGNDNNKQKYRGGNQGYYGDQGNHGGQGQGRGQGHGQSQAASMMLSCDRCDLIVFEDMELYVVDHKHCHNHMYYDGVSLNRPEQKRWLLHSWAANRVIDRFRGRRAGSQRVYIINRCSPIDHVGSGMLEEGDALKKRSQLEFFENDV
ncbi:hypothetical protein CAPTEDRAFT_223676 [Capitella teleta]|uniref:Uncharacterized protein n=1 Tax=Capitella teleta TaxID=283909 RepID=R7UTJ2_CAPTE|nr:hypothetical protein CAPTEDRAFT_223676 [Capitella teleta]|eukprot:ELU09500.1 hypothetical protein CAPTEDRAFT_223676 [Capitella teleta]